MNIQHSSRTDEWYTPLDTILRARQALGGINFDPASSAVANARIGATYFYTKEIDALKTPWPANLGSVFLNPPGGKLRNRSLTELFWQRLLEHQDRFDAAIFLAFSLEAAQSTQRDGKGGVMRFPFCIPRKRIAFDKPDGTPGPAPSHSNVIVYVPGRVNHTDKFVGAFNTLGMVRA